MPSPVLSVAQMREWEQATWASGQTEAVVIAAVGELAAERVLQLTAPGDTILILAGKGHNGDDARAMRDHLPERKVWCLEVMDPVEAKTDLATALLEEPTLIVDGLFGIGLNRPLSADWVEFIQQVNATRLPIVALDVPSGLQGDTGEPQPLAIRADITLTVGAVKQGLLTPAAWEHVGRIEVLAEVGFVESVHDTEQQFTLTEDFVEFPPRRPIAGHKGTFGHVAILAGSLGYHGAAVLAARGAMRARPGLVSVFTQPETYVPVASQLAAAMVHPWRESQLVPENHTALVIGPGLAAADLPKSLKESVRQWWLAAEVPIVVDASALDWLPVCALKTGALRVITPHPGEAARLLGTDGKSIQGNRTEALKQLSMKYGHSIVVLKGHQTLIGQVGGKIYVNSTGNSGLGQGGSGDLLAGYLGGLLAQPACQTEALRTVRYAVWRHGLAADELAAIDASWTIEDLSAVL